MNPMVNGNSSTAPSQKSKEQSKQATPSASEQPVQQKEQQPKIEAAAAAAQQPAPNQASMSEPEPISQPEPPQVGKISSTIILYIDTYIIYIQCTLDISNL